MNFKQKLNHVRGFVFDLDGVLTDGGLLVLENGQYIRKMNIKDGYALQLAVKKGYPVAVISGGSSQAVSQRLHNLGITHVYMDVKDKVAMLQRFCSEAHLVPDEILFMGDDMPDYEVMQEVGVATCPANACIDIVQCSEYISPYKGGEGCVRDVIEQVLRLQGQWINKEKTEIQSR